MTDIRAEDVRPGMCLMAGIPGWRRPRGVDRVEWTGPARLRIWFGDFYHAASPETLFDRTDS